MNKYIQILFLILFTGVLTAQTYNLDQCIEIALQNNLDLKSADITTKSSDIDLKRAKALKLPEASLDYNLGLNFGRSIDPFTNDYINQQLTFSNVGLNLGINVFNGFRTKNTLKQARAGLNASEMERKAQEDIIRLNVSLAYIQILNNIDVLNLSNQSIISTLEQLERLNILSRQEAGDPAALADMQGQHATGLIQILDAQTALQSSILNITQIMNIPYSEGFIFERLDGNLFELYPDDVNTIYSEALQAMPIFKAREFRIAETQSGIDIAKSSRYPNVYLFGGLNSNFSSVARTFVDQGSSIVETGDYIDINSNSVPVLRQNTNFSQEKIGYGQQIYNNISSAIGVSVAVPIFDRFVTKNNIAQSKLLLENANLQLESSKVSLRQSIEQAYLNMASSFQKLESINAQVDAFTESLRINQVRFDNGVSNMVAYIISKNNLERSKILQANAQYEYLLRSKVLDYFRMR